MFSGSIPALVTPMRGETIDEAAFRDLVDWQIDNGSAALVACGTTGESATLTMPEHHRLVRLCVEQAAGRVPVIAGCGSNDTATALAHLHAAAEAGADAALVVMPYYNRPSQAGLIAHFARLTAEAKVPIVLYNVPGRTVTDLLPDTLETLAGMPGIVGIKDASGRLERVSEHRRTCGTVFCQLSGNDDTTLAYLAMGGHGAISVTANVTPRLCLDLYLAWSEGRIADALALQDRLYPLHKAMFSDASPGPAKYALSRVRPGWPAGIRLPLTMPSAESRRAVDMALAEAGLT